MSVAARSSDAHRILVRASRTCSGCSEMHGMTGIGGAPRAVAMSVTYRLIRPEEETAALNLWAEALAEGSRGARPGVAQPRQRAPGAHPCCGGSEDAGGRIRRQVWPPSSTPPEPAGHRGRRRLRRSGRRKRGARPARHSRWRGSEGVCASASGELPSSERRDQVASQVDRVLEAGQGSGADAAPAGRELDDHADVPSLVRRAPIGLLVGAAGGRNDRWM
jgi:hypothetical protein